MDVIGEFKLMNKDTRDEELKLRKKDDTRLSKVLDEHPFTRHASGVCFELSSVLGLEGDGRVGRSRRKRLLQWRSRKRYCNMI